METGQKYPYETATAEQRKVGSYWWNIHHTDLIEVLTEPIEDRVECIREEKPERERECRLKNMAPVLQPEVLPTAYTGAVKAIAKARKAHYARQRTKKARNKARNAFWKADEALARARKACTEELEALHNGEYPENTWTGKSIFKKETYDNVW